MRPVQGGVPMLRPPSSSNEKAPEPGAVVRSPQTFEEHLEGASSRADAEPPPHPQAASIEKPIARHERHAAHAQAKATPEPARSRRAVGDDEQPHDDAPPADVPLAALLLAARLQPPQMQPVGQAVPQLERPAAPAPQEMTPHDLRASLATAWMQASDPVGLTPDQWHFALAADAHTPLAALRLSGDAVNGWALHVTAARGVAAQQLQDRGERLRSRLQARGQSVRELRIDDEEAGA